MRCEIGARNYQLDDNMREYAEEKIGGLEKYLPRAVRDLALAEVVLIDDPSGREDNRYVCEAVVKVAGDMMVSREGTVNFYAAIDIVEAKLKGQFLKYKDKQTLEPRRERMLGRLTGHTSEADAVTPTEQGEAASDTE